MNTSQNLTDQENLIIVTSFGSSSQDKVIETNTKIFMVQVLKSCNESMSSAHPSTCAFHPTESVALKIYLIKLSFMIYSK